MLHRMNELSIKAANGTLSASDREDINSENQLKGETGRIFRTTKFNETYISKPRMTSRYPGRASIDYEMFKLRRVRPRQGSLPITKTPLYPESSGYLVHRPRIGSREIVDPDNPKS